MHVLPDFLAIDFETSCPGYACACSVGVVRVRQGRIAEQVVRLIHQPKNKFWYNFTRIHGIKYSHVKDEPGFAEVWPDLAPLFEGVSFLAAHNAPFDSRVARECCLEAGLAPPEAPFICTVALSRKVFGLTKANLPAVCEHLGLTLNHHDALSDATACANIVLAAHAREPEALELSFESLS